MKEIERKFLLSVDLPYLIEATNTNGSLYDGLHGTYWGYKTITQHYLKNTGDWAIRVRRIDEDYDGGLGPEVLSEFLETKKLRINDLESHEIENQIDQDQYDYFASSRILTTPALVKRRHRISYPNTNWVWEVDEFLNPEYQGLVLAEIELKSATEKVPMPFWLDREVTAEKKFKNARMARKLEK